MKAIVFEQFGEPASVLSLREMPTPEPGPGQVRVRMLAAPINPSDLLYIRGNYGKRPVLPSTPGFEGVGIVESSGPGMYGKFLVGKRVVVPNSLTGSWAESALVTARQAIPIPNKLPVEQAAMFFVNPATAYIMSRKVLNVPEGDWLLQTAAGSSLGKMVIRLGRKFGFKTINIVRRREQIDELKSLGADVVLAEVDGDVAEQVHKATGGSGVRYAIDPVGGATGSAVVRSLGTGGRMLVFGTLSGEPLSFSSRELMTRDASVSGFWLGNYMSRLGLLAKLKLIRTISSLMLEGVLVSKVSDTFPLDRFSEAIQSAEKPGRGGKTLFKMGEV